MEESSQGATDGRNPTERQAVRRRPAAAMASASACARGCTARVITSERARQSNPVLPPYPCVVAELCCRRAHVCPPGIDHLCRDLERQDHKTTLPGKAFSFLHLRRGGGTSPDGRPSRGRTTYSLKQNKKLNKRPHNSKPTS